MRICLILLFNLISPLWGLFERHRISSWQFLSFSALNMSSHWLLACKVFAGKFGGILSKISCTRRITFFFSCSKNSVFQQFEDVFQNVWISLCLLYSELVELLGCAGLCLLSNLGSFWPSFLQIFFVLLYLLFPLSEIPILYMLVWLMESDKSFRLCSCFFIFFSFCSLD